MTVRTGGPEDYLQEAGEVETCMRNDWTMRTFRVSGYRAMSWDDDDTQLWTV